jgi:acyl carrier protein
MEKDELHKQVSEAMARLFDLDPKAIQPGAHLYEDLDLDSIDAIDLLAELQKLTGRKIAPEDFQHVRTVGDIVNALHHIL